MKPREYRTVEAFRKALDDRLQGVARAKGVDLDRQRQLLVFDRFQARLQEEFGDRILLKGALALLARVPKGRGTRDLDALVQGTPRSLLERIQKAAQLDLGDHLTYTVAPDPDHPEITGEGAVYGGERFRVQAKLAGKAYAPPFGVDLAVGPLVHGEPEEIDAPEALLEFVGIPRTRYRIVPRATHLAEKLHAYTQPRPHPNTRVKDLPDLALLATTGPIGADELREAFVAVFGHRKTHPLPASFPDPPPEWSGPYARMASESSLPWPDLASVTLAVRTFLDPVLAGSPGRWDPAGWRWETP